MNMHMTKLMPAFLMRTLFNFKEQFCLSCKPKICRQCFSSSYSGPVMEEVPENAQVFKPKRVAVLSKMTRYEFEKKRCKTLTEHQLKSYVGVLYLERIIIPKNILKSYVGVLYLERIIIQKTVLNLACHFRYVSRLILS